MSTLSSASSLTAITNAVMDNMSFEEDGSLAKARAFVTAANLWLLKNAGSSSRDGNSLTLNVAQIQAMVEQARAYVAQSAAAGGGVKHFTTSEGFR